MLQLILAIADRVMAGSSRAKQTVAQSVQRVIGNRAATNPSGSEGTVRWMTNLLCQRQISRMTRCCAVCVRSRPGLPRGAGRA